MSRVMVPQGAGGLVAVNGRNGHAGAASSGKSPVYQIDFSAVACGSRVASTKRKIRWRFGFTNLESLDAGLTGQDCRGEEHDISLTWSIASGKRVLHVDQQEVHYSNSRSGIFEFSWTMRGNHVLKVVAHASPPLASTPGFRQYEFFVDGMSFFSFPKVFRLNLANNDGGRYHYNTPTAIPRAENGGRRVQGDQPIWKLEQPQNEQEEEAILREIMMKSLQEDDKKKIEAAKAPTSSVQPNAPPPSGGNELLDFFGAPAIQRNNSDPGPPENPDQPYVDGSMSFAGTDTAPHVASQAPPAGAWAQPTNTGYEFASAPAPHSASYNQHQYAQPAYANTPAGYAVTPHNTPAQYTAAPAAVSTPYVTPSYAVAPTPVAYNTPAPEVSYTTAPETATFSTSAPESSYAPASAPEASYTAPTAFAAPVPESSFAPSPAPELSTYSTPAQEPNAYAAPELHSNTAPVPDPDPVAAPMTFDSYSDAQTPAPAAQPSLDLNVGNTLADKAYLDIANNFSLTLDDPKEDTRANPFDAPNTVAGPKPTLEGLKTSKPGTAKKAVMAPGAIVMSSTQQGNWGSYGQSAPAAANQGYNQAGGNQQYGYGNYSQGYAGQSMTQQQAPYNNMQNQQYPQQQQQQYAQQQPQQYAQQKQQQQGAGYNQYQPNY